MKKLKKVKKQRNEFVIMLLVVVVVMIFLTACAIKIHNITMDRVDERYKKRIIKEI